MRPAVFVLLACAAHGQTARPTFEAASVKLNTSGSTSSSSNGTRGQIIMINQPLKRLVERAYAVKPFQVVVPDWVDGVRVDVAAKYPLEAGNEDRILMLRALLEDRFKLAVHKDTREMPGFALSQAKGGFKLKPVENAAGGGDTSTNSDGRKFTMTAKKIPVSQLVDLLARQLNAVVLDKTEIAGSYDFELHWSLEDGDTDSTPSLILAVQDTLGLRLQSQKVPVEVVIVDHLERSPIEN